MNAGMSIREIISDTGIASARQMLNLEQRVRKLEHTAYRHYRINGADNNEIIQSIRFRLGEWEEYRRTPEGKERCGDSRNWAFMGMLEGLTYYQEYWGERERRGILEYLEGWVQEVNNVGGDPSVLARICTYCTCKFHRNKTDASLVLKLDPDYASVESEIEVFLLQADGKGGGRIDREDDAAPMGPAARQIRELLGTGGISMYPTDAEGWWNGERWD